MIIRKIICLLLAASLFTSCSKKQAPNIVWIISEDNSKHYMKMFDPHGVETPHLDSLADHGIIFSNAFSNAPVCSAARSTLISGCYGPRIFSHYHRKIAIVPMPEGLEMFPSYLHRAGYYTSNNHKEDYNIIKSDSVWDMSSDKATWRDRKEGQPFFHMHNIYVTHEGRVQFSEEDYRTNKTKVNPDSCFIQPNHPETELFKYTNAFYRDRIVLMDSIAGDIIEDLRKDGLLENTFIFYFGDHGGVLPQSKGYINETGLNVPLIVYIPPKYKHLVNLKPGSKTNGFVSFVDFGPTVLDLAGLDTPKEMDGKAFLGKDVSAKELKNRDETFSYADRFDEKYDMVRALRKGNIKYIRNFQPFNFDGLMNVYRYKQLAYQEWRSLYDSNKLNAVQSQFFRKKSPECLYDIETDPFETNNLANDPAYREVLEDMRSRLNNQLINMPDLSFYPEFFLVKHAAENPVAFGQKHKDDIQAYLAIANLMIEDYSSVKNEIKENLKSPDPWKRYWALIVCSAFGDEAANIVPLAKQVAGNDDVLINRVRAAEFLGLIGAQNPVNTMTDALYSCTDQNEALLITNSMVLMQDGDRKYHFNISPDKLYVEVRKKSNLLKRLKYLEPTIEIN